MPTYLEIEVSLRNVVPEVWRRFLLPEPATFGDLHRAIQDALGWKDQHAWEFRDARGEVLARPADRLEAQVPWRDAARVHLDSFFSVRGPKKCDYVYDLGDRWEHVVAVRRRREVDETFTRRLLDGAGATPPEDCGGIEGYERCREFVTTGRDPAGDPEELKSLLGEWRPHAFDLGAARRRFTSR